MRVAGIMSGTSLDGIDVAIVDIAGRGFSQRLSTIARASTAYPDAVRAALLRISNATAHTGDVARLSFLLGELYAEAVATCCAAGGINLASIELIGCHGQTIFHEGSPVDFLGRRIASTFQIGETAVIAERTGIRTIGNFREADVAAGGRGAPLVPYVDYLLFRHPERNRVALNIGGIANITSIPAGGAPEHVVAFDTGPGNMVSDALAERLTGKHYDAGGTIAERGTVREDLLSELLTDPHCAAPPPKSAGREQYGVGFVEALLASGVSLEDLIATAMEFTARTIALGIHQFAAQPVDDLIASGGGVHNRYLMRRLRELLPQSSVETTAAYGIDPDAKEAIAFAVLAYESLHGRPANLASATGARRPAILGKIAGR